MAFLLIFNRLGASRKRQLGVAYMDVGEGREQDALSFATFTNGITRADPMTEGNALGLGCKPRLDLTIS